MPNDKILYFVVYLYLTFILPTANFFCQLSVIPQFNQIILHLFSILPLLLSALSLELSQQQFF